MRTPVLNPIKFFDPASLPDFLNIFPNADNTPFGDAYTFGINASISFIKYHIGDLYLQFEAELSDNMVLMIYKSDDLGIFSYTESVIGSNISPSGWVSKPMYKFSLDLDDGYYYLKFNNGYRSDYFKVFQSSCETTKELVKINYSHSTNKFGCIFGENYFTTYFRGQLTPDEPIDEIVSFEGDNELINLKSTPSNTSILNLLGVHWSYLKNINTIFACDTLIINGIQFVNKEKLTWTPVKGGDIGDVTVKLREAVNDYFYSGIIAEPVEEMPDFALDYNEDIFTDYNEDKFTIIVE